MYWILKKERRDFRRKEIELRGVVYSSYLRVCIEYEEEEEGEVKAKKLVVQKPFPQNSRLKGFLSANLINFLGARGLALPSSGCVLCKTWKINNQHVTCCIPIVFELICSLSSYLIKAEVVNM